MENGEVEIFVSFTGFNCRVWLHDCVVFSTSQIKLTLKSSPIDILEVSSSKLLVNTYQLNSTKPGAF